MTFLCCECINARSGSYLASLKKNLLHRRQEKEGFKIKKLFNNFLLWHLNPKTVMIKALFNYPIRPQMPTQMRMPILLWTDGKSFSSAIV